MSIKINDAAIKDLPRFDLSVSDRVGSSGYSKGNQLKWFKDGFFVKKDALGYEHVAEVVVSTFLSYTDIPGEMYVKYNSCSIYEEGKFLGVGCYSKDYSNGLEELSVASILESSLRSFGIEYDDLRVLIFEKYDYDIKDYIGMLLSVDAIVRNEDRHFGNIVFLHGEHGIIPAPMFDFGDSCLSDTVTYQVDGNYREQVLSTTAKPFNSDFLKQIYWDRLIGVRYDDFVQCMKSTNKLYRRAYNVILYGLELTEGKVWRRL